MSDKDEWYLDSTPKPSLGLWIFQQMSMGAIWAALVLFGFIAVILILRAIAFLLPEDPFATLELGTRALSALV
ncbi:MAG: RC-LH1 core complex protein PufX [Pseudomonadota bacterium]